MGTEADEIRQRRAGLRAEYGALYDRVSAIFFEQDPGGVNFGDNTDEYEGEVDLILPRLRSCQSVDDVECVVFEEFAKMFGDHTPERFHRIAKLIWTELSSLSAVRRPT